MNAAYLLFAILDLFPYFNCYNSTYSGTGLVLIGGIIPERA